MATNKIEIIIKAINQASPTIKKVKEEVQKSVSGWAKLGNAIKSVGSAIQWLGKLPFKVIGIITKAVNGLVKSLISLPGLLLGATVGYGAVSLARSFIDAASAAEQFQLRLQVLLGSVAEGNKLFNEMAIFATKVPKTFREIMEAAAQLGRVMKGGADEIAKWMPLIVDLSAATGLSLQITTDQIIRMYAAGANSAILFRRRGISAMLGFQYGVSYSAEQTRKQLMKMWEDPASNFAGAARLLAHTWEGLLSMFRDQWFLFRTEVMKAGVFEYIKAMLETLLGKIYELRDKGKLAEWAKNISDTIIKVIDTVLISIGSIYDGIHRIVGYLLEAIIKIRRSILEAVSAIPGVTTEYEIAKPIVELRKRQKWLQDQVELTTKSIEKQRETLRSLLSDPKITNEMYREGIEQRIKTTTYWLVKDEDKLPYYVSELEKVTKALKDINAVQHVGATTTEELLSTWEKYAKSLKDFNEGKRAIEAYLKLLRENIRLNERAAKERARAQELSTRQQAWLTGRVEEETEAPITQGAIATGELTAFKIYASAREAMLKHWLDSELVLIGEYNTERLQLAESLYAKEQAALEGQIADLSPRQIQLRQKLLAQQRELEHKHLEELIAIHEEVRKQEEKQLKKDYDKGNINLEQYLIEQKKLVEKYAKEEANIITLNRELSFKTQAKATYEARQEIDAIEIEASKDRAAVYEAARKGELANLNTTLAEQLALIDGRYEEEKEIATKRLLEIIENEETFRKLLGDTRARIAQQTEDRVTEIEREGTEEQEKLRQEQIRREQRAARAAYEAVTVIGSIGDRIKYAKQLIEAEWNARIEAIRQGSKDEAAIRAAENAKQFALLQAQAAEWESLIKQTLEPFQSAFQGFGQGFEDLGTILQWFYEVAGKQSKDFARTVKAVAIAAGIVQSLQAGISALLAGMEFGKVVGNPAVGLAMGSVFMSLAIAAGMAKVAMMQAVQAAHGGFIDQFNKTRRKFPYGGVVPGRSPNATADNIPAQLTAGEFVQPVSAVRHYGASVMEAIRRRAIPRDVLSRYGGMRPHMAGAMFASGGSVADVRAAAKMPSEERIEFTNVNVIDPNLYDQYMASPRGNKTFINLLTKNEDLIRRMSRR